MRQLSRLSWWATAIVAPVGLLAGPFAIADLLSGLIEWKGWIGFLTHYWSEVVSQPVSRFLAHLATILSAPRPPEFVSDYLTLGVIYAVGVARAYTLVEPLRTKGDQHWRRTRSALGKVPKERKRTDGYKRFLMLSIAPLVWPLLLWREVTSLPSRIVAYAKDPDGEWARAVDAKFDAESPIDFYRMMSAVQLGGLINTLLTILPFVLAAGLLAINLFLAERLP